MSPFTIYSNMHRIFLQSMISYKKIQQYKALDILKNIAITEGDLDVDEKNLKQIIRVINQHINDFNLIIKEMHCEIKNRDYFVLICSVSSLLTRKQNIYNPKETELFRKIIHELILAKNILSLTSCINLSIEIENFGTLTLAEKIIDKFVKDDWFLYTNIERDSLTFSVKSIAEFSSYFNENYKDYINHCGLCHNITFHGKKYFDCSCFFHNHCMDVYKTKVSKHICPKCKNGASTSSASTSSASTSSASTSSSHNRSLKRKIH